MPNTEKDILKDWDDAYGQSYSHWGPWLINAKRNMEYEAGKQWDPNLKQYLKLQRREALTYNKCRRIKNMISGYQRKNRLSMRIDPTGGADQKTASQLSNVVMHVMNTANGYHVMSEAFEKGPIVSGLNLVHLYMDYYDDPLNGDIRIKRIPYNRFLLDPQWTELALRDSRYLLRREYLDPADARALVPPGGRKRLADIDKHGGRDEKFPYFAPARVYGGSDQWRYDEFWSKERVPATILIDPVRMEMAVYKGPKDRLNFIMQSHPQMRVLKTTREQVTLNMIIEGRWVYSGPAPQGIDEYPFQAVAGYFTPEQETSDLKIQAVMNDILDPQTELNKRRSKMLDIVDSQISSGWEAFEDTLVDPNVLYQSGQAKVVWKKKSAKDYPPTKIAAADIPQGLFALNELFERDIMDAGGANQELFGSPDGEADVASMLAKQRQGAGLTTHQGLFDGYRLTKKGLGIKVVKMIQKNYSPQKVARIIEEMPSQEFFSGSFSKYDCTPVEGVISDSQRQMHYAQLFALKVAGAPIPWAAIIEAAPLERKDQLIKMMDAQQKAQEGQQKQQQMLAQLEQLLKQAKLKSDLAGADEKATQAQENRAGAVLDRIKTLKELETVDVDQLTKLAQLISTLRMDEQIAPGGATPPAGSAPPSAPAAPGGQRFLN